jgi:hypothetical protein
MSDFAIHLTAHIVGEAASILSRTRAKRASGRTPVACDGLARNAKFGLQIATRSPIQQLGAADQYLPVNLTFTAWDLGLSLPLLFLRWEDRLSQVLSFSFCSFRCI